jgi:tetrahydromethanopterin S-methyltransferase subunit G
MKKKQQKITTIDDLATLIQGEFLVIRDRFNSVDQRFDGIDQRLDGMDQRFDGIDQRFDEVDGKIETLRVIVNRIDMRTQNQVDLIYEENTVMKKDMKAMKVDIMTTKTLSQKNKKDITSIKAHVGMKR